MKHCPYCGKDFADELVTCPSDGRQLEPSGAAPVSASPAQVPPRQYVMSPQEARFWQRMTFRQFAVLIIRIQALWLFLDAIVEATYLVNYLNLSSPYGSYFTLSPASKLSLFLLILRIILHVAAAIAIIQKAEAVLGWLVKDSVQEQSSEANEKIA
jgi:hypothetical protein